MYSKIIPNVDGHCCFLQHFSTVEAWWHRPVNSISQLAMTALGFELWDRNWLPAILFTTKISICELPLELFMQSIWLSILYLHSIYRHLLAISFLNFKHTSSISMLTSTFKVFNSMYSLIICSPYFYVKQPCVIINSLIPIHLTTYLLFSYNPSNCIFREPAHPEIASA